MSILSSRIRLFRPSQKAHPDPFEPFDEDAFFGPQPIEVLRKAQWRQGARPIFELLSGAPHWEDEKFEEFMMACIRTRCGRYQDPFLYRLFLITGDRNPYVDYERCKASWEQLMVECPSWPGFRADRATPEICAMIQDLIAKTMKRL
jgi:hypothetical protein